MNLSDKGPEMRQMLSCHGEILHLDNPQGKNMYVRLITVPPVTQMERALYVLMGRSTILANVPQVQLIVLF